MSDWSLLVRSLESLFLSVYLFLQTWSGRGQGVRMSLIKSESHFWNCTVWVILKQSHTMCVHVLVGLLLSPQRNIEAFHSFSCQMSTGFINFRLLLTLLGLLSLTKSLYILQCLPEPSLPLSCPFLTVFWSSSVPFSFMNSFHGNMGPPREKNRQVYLGMKNGLPFMRLHSGSPLCQSTC